MVAVQRWGSELCPRWGWLLLAAAAGPAVCLRVAGLRRVGALGAPLAVAPAGCSSAGPLQGRSSKSPARFLRVGRSARAGAFAPAGNEWQRLCAVHPPPGWCQSGASPVGSIGGGGGCGSLSREWCRPLRRAEGPLLGLGQVEGDRWKGTCPRVGSATVPAPRCDKHLGKTPVHAALSVGGSSSKLA